MLGTQSRDGRRWSSSALTGLSESSAVRARTRRRQRTVVSRCAPSLKPPQKLDDGDLEDLHDEVRRSARIERLRRRSVPEVALGNEAEAGRATPFENALELGT